MAEHPPDRTISSANDEYQLLQALLDNRNQRHRQGRFLVQGVKQIEAALAAAWPLDSVLARSDGKRSIWAHDVLSELTTAGVELVEMPGSLLDALGQRDDGCELVVVGSLPSTDLTRRPVVDDVAWVLGEGITSPGNVGTLLRSCDAFGVHAVVLTARSADPFDPQAVRASTGAVFTVPLAVAGSVADAIEVLRAEPPDLRVVGLDEGGEPLADLELGGAVAIVAGSESRGLSRKAREACDVLASIPMSGTVSSLNVSVATSIALYEIHRRRRN